MSERNDRSRPAGNQAASNVIKHGDETSVATATAIVRCTRCDRPLSHPLSVEAERGPVCRLVVEAVAA